MSLPSFSSFPQSFDSFPDLEPGPSKQSDSPRVVEDVAPRKKKRDRKRRSSRDEDRKKIRGKLHKDDAEEGLQPESSETHRRTSRHRVDDERTKAHGSRHSRGTDDNAFDFHSDVPRLYFSDRKGDPLNVTYGGLHAGDVPKYNLAGFGKKILGLDQAFSVVYRSGKTVEIALGGKRRSPQLTDAGSYALLTSGKTRRLLASTKNASKYQEIDGFLPLPSRRGHHDDQAYRSITMDENANSDSDSSSPGADDAQSSDDDSDTTPLNSRQEALRALEETLTARPSSISSWLSLLDHSLENVPLTSKNANTARSEITVSILSRALSAAPENRHDTYLRLKYLKSGEEVWHESKLKAEWENALKETADADVWMEWLDWRIRKGMGGIEGLVGDAARGLGKIAQGSSAEDVDVARLRVLWRIAVFFKEAGYVERGSALFQAQAELLFAMPDAIYKLPFDRQLAALEEFWESEVPRLGEPSARGWQSWNPAIHHADPITSLGEHPKVEQSSHEDPYTRWASTEYDADQKLQMPSKSADDDDTADPYSTILFSDIRSLLISLQTATGKEIFRFIWLSYLGLHIPGFSASLSSLSVDNKWTSNHFTTPAFLASLFPARPSSRLVTAGSYAGVMVGGEKVYGKTFGIVKEWGYGTLDPLEGIGLGGVGRMWEEYKGDAELIRLLFGQLRIGKDDTAWDILALTFEAAVNIKSATKLSRSLLSDARSSTALWAAHSRLERIRGREGEARKVYRTILSSWDTNSPLDLAQIWWDYAELEWLSSQHDEALKVILRAAGQSNAVEGINILRAKRRLEEIAGEFPPDRWKDRSMWIKLRVLLEVLNGSIQGAMKLADNYLRRELEGSVQHESLTVAVLLIAFHYSVTLRSPCPPAILRDRVCKALECYPSNTIALGVFLECEKGEGVWGRVRELLGEASVGRMKKKSLARRVAEVYVAGWERGRWEGEIERVRTGLEAAVTSDQTRGSSILWRIYIELEIRAGEFKRAKILLFRAVGECPFVKELYLLAFGPLRSVYSPGELNIFAETMAERGLRMRSALDEVLGGWDGGRNDNDSGEEDSGGDEGDLERDSRELRRLMPY